MDIATGILQSARALGVSPVDLATAISYETAGTFDPTKAGPTTQWGRHRGLIQFGEPQAEQYGVDWSNPIGSQLGQDGAVVKYLRSTGVRPGMGLMDIYSAINAGGVGRYNASDANNGGAPGTVADKVNNQMAGHRAKAMSLLGGEYEPDAGHMVPVNGGSMNGILGGFLPREEDNRSIGERLKDGAKDGSLWDALAVGLNSMRGSMADEGIARSAGARMAERKQEAQQNQTAEWLRSNGRADLADAMQAGMISGQQAFEMMQPQEVERQGLVNAGDGMIYDPNSGEWITAPNSGQIEPLSPIGKLTADHRAGLITDEAYQQALAEMAPKGMTIESDGQGGFRMIQGVGGGVAGKPLTEGQSKDVGFATRARAALDTLETRADGLTSRGQAALEAVPFGFGRDYQDPQYQIARNAADNLMLSILRKDTGAAVTPSEEAAYGRVFLPQPGDSPELLAQKSRARVLAVEGLEAGMPSEAILAQGQALLDAGTDPNAGAGTGQTAAPDFSTMSDQELNDWIANNGG